MLGGRSGLIVFEVGPVLWFHVLIVFLALVCQLLRVQIVIVRYLKVYAGNIYRLVGSVICNFQAFGVLKRVFGITENPLAEKL